MFNLREFYQYIGFLSVALNSEKLSYLGHHLRKIVLNVFMSSLWIGNEEANIDSLQKGVKICNFSKNEGISPFYSICREQLKLS